MKRKSILKATTAAAVLAVLGTGLHRLKLANALKSALSVVTASVNIVVFGLFGPIHWDVVLVAAPASLVWMVTAW